jgi:hypothetical protein
MALKLKDQKRMKEVLRLQGREKPSVELTNRGYLQIIFLIIFNLCKIIFLLQ